MDTVLGLSLGVSIVLLAGLTQGLTSFGFALISVPFLSMVLPISEVVPIVVILSLGTNIIIMVGSYKDVELGRIWILVTSSLIAAPLGALALVHIPSVTIKLSVGLVVLVVSGLMLSGRAYPLKSERLAYVPIGLLSGFLNGSISMSGPPVALFLSNQNTTKETFRANITMYAIILNCFTLAVFFGGGLLTKTVVVNTLWLIPSMFIGVVLGNALVARVSQPTFKKVVLVLVSVSGLWTVVGAFQQQLQLP